MSDLSLEAPERLYRWEDLRDQRIWPFSAPAMYRAIKEGRFPQPVRVGARVAWRERDLIDWQAGLKASTPRPQGAPLQRMMASRLNDGAA